MVEASQTAGMTVYGQIAIDHIVDVNDLLRVGPVTDILHIGKAGELIFAPGSYLETEEAYIPWFFGPFGTYFPGEKHWADEVIRFGGRVIEIIEKGLVRQLGVPNKDLGGGGPNNIKLLHQVFRSFPIQFIGTYRRRPPEERGADIWEYALGSRVSKLNLVPLHEHPPINICFEGVGPKEDRTIIRSPFPALSFDRLRDIKWPEPEGSTIIINTIYTATLAVEALITATTRSNLAIIACTDALCSKQRFSDMEIEFFRYRYPTVDFSDIFSVHDLILKYVLPNSGAIIIANEKELEHLTGTQIIDRRGLRYLGGVLSGLDQLQQILGNHRGKIIFTMGKEGSLCLDENRVLHHCGITESPGQIAGKTGIGDLYAGTIMGYEHIKRSIRGEVTNVAFQMTAAAAAADIGVTKGFRAVNVLGIDSGILESWKKYTWLGPLHDVARRAEKLYGPISDAKLEEIEWIKISESGKGLSGPTLLEDDIGRKWLCPPFVNSEAQ